MRLLFVLTGVGLIVLGVVTCVLDEVWFSPLLVGVGVLLVFEQLRRHSAL